MTSFPSIGGLVGIVAHGAFRVDAPALAPMPVPTPSPGSAPRPPIADLPRPEQLARLWTAATSHPENRWEYGRDIGAARNAHITNTPTQLEAALEGPFDYLEGDIQYDARNQRPYMAHDAGDHSGLATNEWLDLGAASGRGLKLDFKDGAAILPTLELAKARGIADDHLVVNVGVGTDRATLAHARDLYPDAYVNLSPGSRYDANELYKLQDASRFVGGNVQFPLKWDLLTQDVINQLKPYGRIAIWNDPDNGPTDIAAEIARLRLMGVDGTIDLRNHR